MRGCSLDVLAHTPGYAQNFAEATSRRAGLKGRRCETTTSVAEVPHLPTSAAGVSGDSVRISEGGDDARVLLVGSPLGFQLLPE